jgi:hypothetical protein
MSTKAFSEKEIRFAIKCARRLVTKISKGKSGNWEFFTLDNKYLDERETYYGWGNYASLVNERTWCIAKRALETLGYTRFAYYLFRNSEVGRNLQPLTPENIVRRVVNRKAPTHKTPFPLKET